MNISELLTYADIEQLKQMANHYGCPGDVHSKNQLISSLLHYLGRKSHLVGVMETLTPAEFRFLQQLCFDSRDVFSREELMGKGRAALASEEESPRRLVTEGCRKGWLFPGVTDRNRFLFQVPTDLRRRFLDLFSEKYADDGLQAGEPVAYRNEEGQIEEDLFLFLSYLYREDVQLTSEGAIYRQQQRQLFKMFHVSEEPVDRKGWRFGFGRRYHLYPDRFSLLYDYAFYKGYILEDEQEGFLRLSEAGAGKILNKDEGEGKEIYRFWLRLYRHPIPHVAVIVKWIDLLCRNRWQDTDRIREAVSDWLQPFYYETEERLFHRTLKMMMHLGLLRIGEKAGGKRMVAMNERGSVWVAGIAGFAEKMLDNRYLEPADVKNLSQ